MKRKQGATGADEDGGESDDSSLVNVDFEFFDPNPQIDYLALKRLSNQLFQGDAERLQIQDLADLILSQPLVGTTVKCDGRESDPYAFLTVLNFHVHQNRPSIKALIEYLLSNSSSNPEFHSTLQNLIGPTALQSTNHVAFVFSERLINMPVQIVPPMYRMLADEIQWAIDDNEPYRFTHLVFVTRVYRLSAEEAAELHSATPRTKRNKGISAPQGGGVFSFHPEDELIQKHASHVADYSFSSSEPREKDSFGLDVGGRMMLVPIENLPHLIKSFNETYAPP
ncbi:hypothetical protein NLI96_g5186 [Meripilus lineatus]|uniref:Protein BCP1 n=1 Tax=Meripilus lineatus TaxID=2056292 RepID=A0AAD5YF09_9APHY|nr:hypothetical protein NLI96_g5186 [Physisporinus lineatus]